MQSDALRTARANAVVIDERNLTRAVNGNDVKQTLEDFRRRTDAAEASGDTPEAEFVISTDESSEARARDLLESADAALHRMFGNILRVDVSILTHQPKSSAKLHVTKAALQRVARAVGLANLPTTELENFVAMRASTEYQCLLLRFENSDVLRSPDLEISLRPSGRTLRVARRQQFR
jgi:hypothetical protein